MILYSYLLAVKLRWYMSVAWAINQTTPVKDVSRF